MQQWLGLFLQYALPIFKAFATAKSSESLQSLPYELADSLTQTQEMLSVLGVVEPNNHADTLEFALADTPHAAALHAYAQTVHWAMQQTYLDFQKWRWHQEKILHQALATQHHRTLLALAAEQRKTALQLPEVHKILDHWPLRLFPSQVLDTHGSEEPIPLRIFLAPPIVKFEQLKFEQHLASGNSPEIPDLETRLAQQLRDFLNQSYGLHNPVRPTEFLGGAWESKRFHGEASIKALFNLLKSEPTLILESEIDGGTLTIRMAYWGMGQTHYTYRTLVQLPYRTLLEEAAKARAMRWKSVREKLTALGRTPDDIRALGGDNETNLALLHEAETLKAAGIDPSEVSLQYQISSQDWDAFIHLVGTCHCLVAGWVADIHHWRFYGVPPVLPTQVSLLTAGIGDSDLTRQLLESTVSLYGEILPVSELESPAWVPELTLKLAHSLAHLDDPSFARTYINLSLHAWLTHRQLPLPDGAHQDTERAIAALSDIHPVLIPDDRPYFETLADCLTLLGDDEGLQQVQGILEAIATLPAPLPSPPIFLSQSRQVTAGSVLAIDMTHHHCQVLVSQQERPIQLWQVPRAIAPSQAIPQLSPRLLKGHRGTIISLAISLDGHLLVTSDRTQERNYINIWDLATGKLKRTLLGHRKAIHALTLSANGRFLVSGSHKIKLWHSHNGASFRTLFGHRQRVYALTTTPDGRTILSGSEDTTVKIWDVQTGELQRTLTGHQDSVRSLTVSPDGQWAISGSDDYTLRLWDLTTGTVRRILKGHRGTINALAVSPQGDYLVSGSDDATLRIWDMQTGDLLQTLTDHSAAIRALAFSPDGTAIASICKDGNLNLWHTNTEGYGIEHI